MSKVPKAKNPPENPPEENEIEEIEETPTPVSAKPFNPMAGNTNNRKRLKEDEDDFNAIKSTLAALDEKISKVVGGAAPEPTPTKIEPVKNENPPTKEAAKPWHEEWLI